MFSRFYNAMKVIGISLGEFSTVENDHGRVRYPKQDKDHGSCGPVS